MIPLGIRIYGLGAVAIGLVGIAWGDFALQWQPVAADLPARSALAYLFSAALVLAGMAVNWRPFTAVPGSAALIGLYGIVVVLMQGAQLIQHPGSVATWNGVAEQLALVAGAVAAFALLMAPGNPRSPLLIRSALFAMGLCLLTFGTAHFVYLDFTASMVPHWIVGGQKFWAAVTGGAHLAAGLALLCGVRRRLAAILLTVMFGSFSLLIHLPALLANPHSQLAWVINAINLALTGAAWIMTDPRLRTAADLSASITSHPAASHR